MRVRFDAYSFARFLARYLNICEYLKMPLKMKNKVKTALEGRFTENFTRPKIFVVFVEEACSNY